MNVQGNAVTIEDDGQKCECDDICCCRLLGYVGAFRSGCVQGFVMGTAKNALEVAQISSSQVFLLFIYMVTCAQIFSSEVVLLFIYMVTFEHGMNFSSFTDLV